MLGFRYKSVNFGVRKSPIPPKSWAQKDLAELGVVRIEDMLHLGHQLLEVRPQLVCQVLAEPGQGLVFNVLCFVFCVLCFVFSVEC